MSRTCAACQRAIPRWELASIATGDRIDYYCHRDQEEPTCYERASRARGHVRFVRDYDLGLVLEPNHVVCSQCGNVFEAVRSTARFCSDACKMRHHRRATVTLTDPLAHSPTG